MEFNFTKDIFISYSSRNVEKASRVKDFLEKLAFTVWMDKKEIAGGKDYSQEIPEGIENCKVLVLLLSPDSQQSKWVEREIQHALSLDKKIIPFMIEECELNTKFAFYLANMSIIRAYEDMNKSLLALHNLLITMKGLRRINPIAVQMRKTFAERKRPMPKTEPEFYSLGITEEKEQIEYALARFKEVDINSKETPGAEKEKAFEMLRWAANKGNHEAMFILGKLLAYKKLRIGSPDYSCELGMDYLYRAAREGCREAEKLMDNICDAESYAIVASMPLQENAPLRDHDGWKFSIKHKSAHLPVKAELINGRHMQELHLTVSVYVGIKSENDDLVNAIKEGIKGWEEIYLVFGNQHLKLAIDVVFTDHPAGAVCIMPMRPENKRIALLGIVTENTEKVAQAMADGKDSVITFDKKKWSVGCGKTVCLNNMNGVLDDMERVRRAIRYEFGHVLGLDDMANIPKGTYPELDPYYIKNGVYDLVMHDRLGLISRNDIEMVVLALAENKLQRYNEGEKGEPVSKALGRGN